MNVIFILIGFSLLVAIGFLIAFIWSVKNGQYEDEYTPSVRILFEDDIAPIDEKEPTEDPRSKKPDTSNEKDLKPNK